jgi:hypothetical protein
MGWFRTNRHWGAWCAILALACQLVLTFNHVHAPAFGARSTLVRSTRSLAQRSPADEQVRRLPVAPAPISPKTGDDPCPICALIHLTESLVLTDLPALPVPIAAICIAQAISTDGERVLSFVNLFRARAPPLA